MPRSSIEQCVFAGVSTPGFSQPEMKGDNGECFAQAGEQMSGCCYHAAEKLILLEEIKTVEEIQSTLQGRSRSAQSRRQGVTNALLHYS